MKQVFFASLFIFLLSMAEKPKLRTVEQDAFKRGEVLDFKVYYGFVNAAKATLKVSDKIKTIAGRPTYHVVGTGKSTGAVDVFFEVDDRYESFIDQESLSPWVFLRRVNEGGYSLKRNVYFNQYKKKAKVRELKDSTMKSFETKAFSQDLLSAFYYARTLDLRSAKKEQEFTIQTFFDHENYPMKIKFLGRDTIKTDLGKFACLKFRPMLQEGRVFKEKESMHIWLSDDKNKVPIRLKTKLLVGSLKMDLESHKGLVTSLNKVED